MEDENNKYCSFCKLPSDEVATLIQGPKIWICNSCVEQCTVILEKKPDYYPITEETVHITLPSSNTTIGKLRALLALHHYNTKIEIKLE